MSDDQNQRLIMLATREIAAALSTRNLLTAHAVTGLLNGDPTMAPKDVAEQAVKIADAVQEELARTAKKP